MSPPFDWHYRRCRSVQFRQRICVTFSAPLQVCPLRFISCISPQPHDSTVSFTALTMDNSTIVFVVIILPFFIIFLLILLLLTSHIFISYLSTNTIYFQININLTTIFYLFLTLVKPICWFFIFSINVTEMNELVWTKNIYVNKVRRLIMITLPKRWQ